MERLRINFKWYILLALSSVTAGVWYVVLTENQGAFLRVSFLDIGQGDAILIEAPNGNKVLIDGGPTRAVLSELGKILPFYDRNIDMVVVSNPDLDHIGGLVYVLEKYKVEFEIEPGTLPATAVYTTLQSTVANAKVNKIIAKIGEKIILDKKRNITLTILFPDRNVSGMATNDGSIIAELSYGKTCAIFGGDAPRAIEEYIVKLDGKRLDCDLLKVGHHGSRTSTSPAFVAAVSPEYAVISLGKGNSYGHPHKETLDTLNNFGSKILRTDELGTITFVSDGERITLKNP